MLGRNRIPHVCVLLLFVAGVLLMHFACVSSAAPQPANASPYARWKMGPPSDPGYFPIAVWLQNPRNAAAYKKAGINLYVGLWHGPTQKQLDGLRAAGMPVICQQNRFALAHLNDPIIVGWMHGDEPDNAQSLGRGKGYGPPISPEKIVAEYDQMHAADPTRPIMLNLGQGVAWDGWYGRGVRTNHPEDYAAYVKGCDLASFDIYPVVSPDKPVTGRLQLVAYGVDRLRQWAGPNRIVWNCIECTHISNAKVMPTPNQVRAEVWMSLIHGSRGIIYFVHQFAPTSIEDALLQEPEMLKAVTDINRRIHELAPMLNSPSLSDDVTVSSSVADVPIDAMLKRQGGATYLFAVAMRKAPAKATFQIKGLNGEAKVEVLGEGRSIRSDDGRFTDSFEGYGVHLYRIVGRP